MWQNDIKKDSKEVPWEGMEWIDATQEQVADCCQHGKEPSGFHQMRIIC